jgi:hypothetical protein
MSTNYNKFSHQINVLSKSIPSIVQNVDKQQTQLLAIINEQNTINGTYASTLQALHKQQNQQSFLIKNIQTKPQTTSLRKPSTPLSLEHVKKKPRKIDNQDLSDSTMQYNVESIHFDNDTSILTGNTECGDYPIYNLNDLSIDNDNNIY